MTVGVYRITNTVNGKYYIGISHNVELRLGVHLYWLGRGLHHNQYLQNAWDKYGRDAFVFALDLECSKEEAVLEEQRVLQTNFDETYNLTLESSIGRNPQAGWSEERKREYSSLQSRISFGKSPYAKWSSERKLEHSERMSRLHSERFARMTSEEREAWRLSRPRGYKRSLEAIEKTRQGNLGRKRSDAHNEIMRLVHTGRRISEETREKMRSKKLGKSLTLEHRQKIGEAGRGKTRSEETRQKMSESWKLRGPKPPESDETRRRKSEAHLGRTLTQEQKDLRRIGLHRTLQLKRESQILSIIKCCLTQMGEIV